MSVYRDKQRNTWFVVTRYKDWTGKAKQTTKRGFRTKHDAQRYESLFIDKKKDSTDILFKNFVEIYLESMEYRIKENTLMTKQNIFYHHIVPYLGEMKLDEITPKDIIHWQDQVMKDNNYKQTYLKTIHNQLSALFNYAVRFYGLKSNPARLAGNMGKEEVGEMKFWTKEEYLTFSRAMMNKEESYHAFEILYWCGIRLGELLALTAEDFDFEKKTLRINKSYQRIKGKDVITTPKTRKSIRVLTLPDFLAAEMQDYISRLPYLKVDDRIFTITKSGLHHEIDRGCRETGVKRIRVHDLRHPYVKHTTKIFSLRLKVFQAQPVPDALRKTRGAFLHLREGGNHNPFLRPCNKKLSSWSIPQSKMSLILYAISMRLSGYTSTLSMRRSVSSAVNPSELKTALAASCRLSCRACSSCFCFACANTTA